MLLYVYVLILYLYVDAAPMSSPLVFDSEYVLTGQTESTSSQTLVDNSTPRCLPAPAWRAQSTENH